MKIEFNKIVSCNLEISLNPLQEKQLDAVRWLLNPNQNIATGRSFLMATVFIERACNEVGNEIRFFDHFPTFNATKHNMRHLIRMLLDNLNCDLRKKKLEIIFEIKQDRFVIKGILPIQKKEKKSNG